MASFEMADAGRGNTVAERLAQSKPVNFAGQANQLFFKGLAEGHLLIAGGMTVQPKSVAAIQNGYILRNDGYSDVPYSNLQQVLKYMGGDAQLSANLSYKRYDVPQNLMDFLPHPPSFIPGTLNPQRLVIYDPQPLPPLT